MAAATTEKKHKAWIDGVAGGMGGTLSKTMLAPFQRVVVLKQLGEYPNKSSFQLAQMIVEKEGFIKGFWRGNLTSVLQRFPYSGFQLMLYSKIKFLIQNFFGFDGTEKDSANAMFQKFVMKCGAGGIAATIAGVAVYPMDVIRVRLMSGDERYRSITKTAGAIWGETNSPRNFYKGLVPALTQRVPDILINFAVYESVKFGLEDRGFGNVWSTIGGGGAAALTAIVFTFPFDITKRRLAMASQAKEGLKYDGMIHCLTDIYKKQGVAGLYVGAGLEAVRCVPQVIMMWFVIEEFRVLLHGLDEKMSSSPKK